MQLNGDLPMSSITQPRTHAGDCHRKWHHLIGKILGIRQTKISRGENRGDGRQVIVSESGTTKRTHLAPLYHPDTLVNPDTYIVKMVLDFYLSRLANF